MMKDKICKRQLKANNMLKKGTIWGEFVFVEHTNDHCLIISIR